MGINMEPTSLSPKDETLPVTPATLRRRQSLVVGSHHDCGRAAGTSEQSGEEMHLLDSPFCVGDWGSLGDEYFLL